ncbi:hypothetical protein FH972_022140 [Carpinus fangiana]|uniref:Uncharacterized protein n=1 Tax=Carpinus fangiana TaxID=176857 RepID=A0A5N6KRD0_9ROSI|nr:hypothetical protein FH972_022140 [Carpinus fangiana]
MAWDSILPEYLHVVEVWVGRVFLLLIVVIIAPWVVFLVYDILLYFWRSAAHEIPFVGGRARGRQKPSAPGLSEISSGHANTPDMRNAPNLGSHQLQGGKKDAQEIHHRASRNSPEG